MNRCSQLDKCAIIVTQALAVRQNWYTFSGDEQRTSEHTHTLGTGHEHGKRGSQRTTNEAMNTEHMPTYVCESALTFRTTAIRVLARHEHSHTSDTAHACTDLCPRSPQRALTNAECVYCERWAQLCSADTNTDARARARLSTTQTHCRRLRSRFKCFRSVSVALVATAQPAHSPRARRLPKVKYEQKI